MIIKRLYELWIIRAVVMLFALWLLLSGVNAYTVRATESLFVELPGSAVERYAGTGAHWRLNKAASWVTFDASTNVYLLAWNSDKTPNCNGRAHGFNGGDYLLSFYRNQANQCETNFKMETGGRYTPPAKGAYGARMDGASDRVTGLGFFWTRHAEVWLSFDWVEGGETPVPTTLKDAAMGAARSVTWMPVNTDAALYKKAQSLGLGFMQADEQYFEWGGETWISQPYNLGVIYCKQGDYDNVYVIQK